jgi:hypothetical protein
MADGSWQTEVTIYHNHLRIPKALPLLSALGFPLYALGF